MSELFKILSDGKLLTHKGETTFQEATKDVDLVGIYFSAHWCGPCRRFTPELAKHYNTWKSEGKKIEIIFVSSDKDTKSFGEYYSEMPWIAVPHGDSRKEKLTQIVGVNGIPWLIVLDKNGKEVENEADSTVSSKGSESINIWLKK